MYRSPLVLVIDHPLSLEQLAIFSLFSARVGTKGTLLHCPTAAFDAMPYSTKSCIKASEHFADPCEADAESRSRSSAFATI